MEMKISRESQEREKPIVGTGRKITWLEIRIAAIPVGINTHRQM